MLLMQDRKQLVVYVVLQGDVQQVKGMNEATDDQQLYLDTDHLSHPRFTCFLSKELFIAAINCFVVMNFNISTS